MMDMFEWVVGFLGFVLYIGSLWIEVVEVDGGVWVMMFKGVFDYDFLVLLIGLVIDLML